ncbi:hypothetical protein AURDEDRAFT_123943 [Auricularia subglabra TFB-10046 SS5]|nr:hypothetical protein AURDEDRAFT_123943 [Auricularia subglabra TFB-10046 SS5]
MLCSITVLLAILSETWARLVNVTFDDKYGDSTTGQFAQYLPAVSCGALTNLTFSIDNIPTNQFFINKATTTVSNGHYTYRALVFKKENLVHKPHQITIRYPRPALSTGLFDYMVYTTEVRNPPPENSNTAPAPTSPTNEPVGRLIAIVASIFAAAFLITTSALWFLRRRGKLRRATAAAADPSTTAWTDDGSQQEPLPVDPRWAGRVVLRAPVAQRVHTPPPKILFQQRSPVRARGSSSSFGVSPEPGPSRAVHSDLADLRAELERMRVGNGPWRQTVLAGPRPEHSHGGSDEQIWQIDERPAELRADMERMWEENAILRQAGPPPQYTDPDGERTEARE